MNVPLWKLAVLAAYISLTVWIGIIPSWFTVGTDFTNYYVGSRLLLSQHQERGRIYEAAWFEREAISLGGAQGAIFQPFPPSTTLLLLPLTSFDIITAKRIWLAVNVAFLGLCIQLLHKVTHLSWIDSSLILFASGFGLVNNIYLGQMYILLLAFLLLGLRMTLVGRSILAGAILGFMVPIKYFPAFPLVVFAVRKDWKLLAGACISSLVVIAIGMWGLGLEVHRIFLTDVLMNHLDGKFQNPFSVSYQSFNSLSRLLFIAHPIYNPSPLIPWSFGYPVFRFVVVATLLFLLIRTLCSIDLKNDRELGLGLALVMSGGLLLTPGMASYHFILLALPLALFLAHSDERHRYLRLSLLVSYAVIGLLPIPLLRTVSFEGATVLLSHPRLYLLLAFFCLGIGLTRRTVAAACKPLTMQPNPHISP